MSDHIIHKFQFIVEDVDQKKTFNKIADKLSFLVRGNLANKINDIFDKYEIPGYHIIIKELEINLGQLNPNNLEYDITHKIELALRKKIASIHIVAKSAINQGVYKKDNNIILKEIEDLGSLSMLKKESKLSLDSFVKSPLIADIRQNKDRFLEAISFYLLHGWLPFYLSIPQEKFKSTLSKIVFEQRKTISNFINNQDKSKQEIIKSRLDKLKIAHQKSEKIIFDADRQLIDSLPAISDEKIERKGIILPELQRAGQIQSKPDNLQHIARAFTYFLKTGETDKSLPYYVSNNREIINQLYRRAPFLLKGLLSDITYYTTDFKGRLTKLVQELNKKQVENLVHLFFANTSNWKKTLNQVNNIYHEYPKLVPDGLKNISKSSIAHAQVLFEILIKPDLKPEEFKTHFDPILNTISDQIQLEFQQQIKIEWPTITQTQQLTIQDIEYLHTILNEKNKARQTHWLSDLIDPKSKNKLSQIVKKYYNQISTLGILPTSLKNFRTYRLSEQRVQLIKNQISQESQSTQIPDYNNNLNKFDKALSEFYMPLTGGKMQRFEEIIYKFPKGLQKKDTNSILQNIDPKKMLNNPFLKNLEQKDFEKTLELLLPTTSFRSFIQMRAKHINLWRTLNNDKNINLIFLSLVKDYKTVNEQNIFSKFMRASKELKGWTFSVLKQKSYNVLDHYEEKMTADQKAQFLEFIDNIPTLGEIKRNRMSDGLEQGIAIRNAGLVILWPFFKTLFQFAGLFNEKGEFIDKEARERGIFLLQYLAVKQSNGEEPYLVFNKILTGFPIDEPISSGITMTEKEKDICDALLLNVIKQWPGMTNSTPDNLRGSFLIRDGVLNFKGDQWFLTVERKAMDLLLNKLTWGYTMIKISWLPYMIKVDWN